ncbi:MAG: peptidoglycan DD-metalloendopeptidase family protein [Chthoniobacterales bacterium]|nr:peptidoglycan DD-metalloendopeptidase family protein [Chthoniobacterales bacterium]
MKRYLTLILLATVIFCCARPVPAQVVNFAPPPTVKKYPFYPQGGNFFGDLFPTNFVDVNPTSGILAYNNSNYTYNGHMGIDTAITGFTAQAIGVPIFAALDGTVIETHDGEFDMNTSFGSPNQVSNFVKIDHGNGQTTMYDHMRKGSVAVVMGQQVTAGQQIGLTASSGYSTAPHLHLQSEVNGMVFEPFSGPARPGISGWVSQPPFRTDIYIEQFVITDQDLSTFAGPPFDTTRKGSFITGVRTFNTWFQFANGEGIKNITVSILRPNGTIDFTTTSPISGFPRNGYVTYNFNQNLDVVGTWKIQVKVNGTVIAAAPFMVLAAGSKIVNHAPAAIEAVFDPAQPNFVTATFCRITSPTLFLDPDYDFVRYHYVWTVNGAVVRNVMSAGKADAIPNNLGHPGDVLTCVVTPSDGTANGPATTVTTAVASPQILLNISTRLNVLTGENVLIGGFIITGNDPKKVIVRALGPSLTNQGVSGVLANPVLELHKPDGSVITNDNWKSPRKPRSLLALFLPLITSNPPSSPRSPQGVTLRS